MTPRCSLLPRLRLVRPNLAHSTTRNVRNASSSVTSTGKKEGDISSAFVSLSGQDAQPLPRRFREIKKALIAGHEEAVRASFLRLLGVLRAEIAEITAKGSAIIPEISFTDLGSAPDSFTEAHRQRGVAVIRGVVSEVQAEEWLAATREYYRANPSTKAFPADRPAVYELYWSPAQVAARAHSNLLRTQRFLLQHWHTASDPHALISNSHPIAYADRLRIRPPGDAAFALGPHVDGGSCERWEPSGYGAGRASGRGGVYSAIFRGEWEKLDPFDAVARLGVISDLYQGAGACSAFRAYQGWLGLSATGPDEGTLLVNPLFSRATAYYLLRPFFAPRDPNPDGPAFLSEDNWDLEEAVEGNSSTKLQGAYPGHGQELSGTLHPHLELQQSMVSVPKVRPGDYIAWHCDTIHAVDKVHCGKQDAAVFYIPACPLTEDTARYLVRQRDTFLNGTPSPDFPGGTGESEHIGRPEPAAFMESSKFAAEGKRAMGMLSWDLGSAEDEQERQTLIRANQILGL